MTYMHKLKMKDWLTLIAAMVIGFGWIMVDQYFLPQVYQRFIALVILLIALIYLQFRINKPVTIFHYANTLALVLLIFCIVVSIVMHVMIKHDISFKSLLICVIAGTMPYVAGYLYKITGKALNS